MKYFTNNLLIIMFLFIASTGYSSEFKLDFTRSSGGHSGQTSMTTTDGTIWTSTVPVYNNGSYYYMEYMFDGLHDAAGWGTGWLGSKLSADYEDSMTITFTEEKYLTHINTFSIMYPSYYSSAALSVSTDGTNYTHKGNVTVGNNNDLSNYQDFSVDIAINEYVKSIKYEFYDVHYGPVITEMEIFSDTNPPLSGVPEPASLMLLFGGIVGYVIIKLRSR